MGSDPQVCCSEKCVSVCVSQNTHASDRDMCMCVTESVHQCVHECQSRVSIGVHIPIRECVCRKNCDYAHERSCECHFRGVCEF